jgi:hypothetical protein
LPKRQLRSPSELFPLFKGELLACFAPGKSKKSIPHHPAPAADDWADVGLDQSTGNAAVIEKPALTPAAVVEYLPDPNTLGRPDDLLLKPPYHLIVHSRGHNELELQCSHSPTLQFLSDYLKKWRRANHQLSTTVRLVHRPF